MNELQLGLVGAGAVIVIAVVVYNAWQGARVRRRMPRAMRPDTDAAASGAGAVFEPNLADAPDERPFIEPARAPRTRPGADVPRREPTLGGGSAGAGFTAPEDTLADSAAAEPDGADSVSNAAGAPAIDAALARADTDDSAVLSATAAASAGLVDRRIDCIVPLRLADLVAAEKVIPLAQRLRRAGGKPVWFEGRQEGMADWSSLRAGERYVELRVAVQLANRSGALNELEFSEFVAGVQRAADTLDATPDFPDMTEVVGMARELDAFAAQCDAQLSVNVVSDGAPWSASYVQAVASQDGLLLSRDGTRFVKLDARQNPVFMLQFGDTNFLRDDLTYKGGHMITLLLDVPVADEDILPFRLMCDYAASLAQRVGARVVDDQKRALPESALAAIEKQLLTLYAKLEQAGIPAGSATARRLFSN